MSVHYWRYKGGPLTAPTILILFLLMAPAAQAAITAITVQQVGITATQAILAYTAPDNNACQVEISESASYSPLVHDVDPALFPGSDSDIRLGNITSGASRVIVVGLRRTDKGADNKFYSRALQTNTKHYYRITCNAESATGSFDTNNILLGNTYTDVPQVDPATGQAVVPTFPNDRTTPVIDPQTGALVRRLWLPQDIAHIPYLNSGGMTRMCGAHLVGPGPGYLCYFPTDGGGPGLVYYIIPPTGEVRFLGQLWISGNGFPYGGATAVAGPSLSVDAKDSRVLYYSVGDTQNQAIIIKGTYTGDYSAVPGGTTASYSWENLTPGPNYYPTKLIQAFDPTFDLAKFTSCGINPGGLDPNTGHSYALLSCNRYQQDSYGWIAAMDMGNGQPMDHCGADPAQCPHIIGAVNVVKNPQTRWCGMHNAKIIPDTPVINVAFHGLMSTNHALGSGPYNVTLTQPIGPGDTTISVSGEPLSADPIEPYLMDAAAGDVFLVNGGAETIRIVSKNSATSWVVARAVVSPETAPAQSWPAGTTLMAQCQQQIHQIQGLTGIWLELYWKFLDDPHGAGTGYILDQYFPGGHYDYQANLRVTGVYTGVQGPILNTINTPLTFTIDPNPTFAGVHTFSDGNAYSDYPSYQQSKAPPEEQTWFLTTREFLGGDAYYGGSGAQLISGQLYKYNFASWWGQAGLHRKQVATIAASGGYNLTDISGPGVILPDTSAASYQYCVAQAPGECHAGSQAGDTFVNAPNVHSLVCAGANGFPNPSILDLCIADMASQGHSAHQYGLIPNSEGVSSGSNWGAGYSRRLSSGFSGIRGQQPLFKPLPDGTWAFFDIAGFMGSWDAATAPGLVMIKMPPFSTAKDSLNRTTFIPITVTIAPPTLPVDNAVVAFGYAEFGNPSSYFCTSRQEACLAVSSSAVNEADPFKFAVVEPAAGVPCAAGCSVTLPLLPQHVAYYQVWYRNASNQIVDRSIPQAITELVAPGVPLPLPISIVSVQLIQGLTSATLNWVTNVPADSQVDYGLSAIYSNSTAVDPALVTTHSQTITGLAPHTLYHFRANSRDASHNLAVSGDLTFIIGGGADATPPNAPRGMKKR